MRHHCELTWARSPFHDEIVKSTLWGPLYDGRAVITPIHEKFIAGASLEECRKNIADEYGAEEPANIITTWAYVAPHNGSSF